MPGTTGVILSAIFFAAIGVTAMIRPHDLLEGFSIETTARDSRNEMRAVYGGFPLAVSGLLLFSLTRPGLSNGILVALAACSAAMAVKSHSNATPFSRPKTTPFGWRKAVLGRVWVR